MQFHYSEERDRRRRKLMEAIEEFQTKPIDVVRDRAIRQLQDSLASLGGPIE